jgi:putative membrane protein
VLVAEESALVLLLASASASPAAPEALAEVLAADAEQLTKHGFFHIELCSQVRILKTGVIMNRSRVSMVIALAAASVLTTAAFAQAGGAAGGAGSQTGGAAGAAGAAGSQAAGAAGAAGSQAAGAAGSQTAGTGSQAAGASTSVPGADKKFAMMVAQTDLAEIQMGNLALQKSTNDDVKKIAQKLVDDHTKTSDAMKQIASQKGLTVPTEPDAKHKALATKLQGESGDQFDKDFITANSADHHKVVKAFQKEADSGKDPDIKGFASQFLPSIQEHTTMIDGAKGKTGGQ